MFKNISRSKRFLKSRLGRMVASSAPLQPLRAPQQQNPLIGHDLDLGLGSVGQTYGQQQSNWQPQQASQHSSNSMFANALPANQSFQLGMGSAQPGLRQVPPKALENVVSGRSKGFGLCRSFTATGQCRYGLNCSFAHGEPERSAWNAQVAASHGIHPGVG